MMLHSGHHRVARMGNKLARRLEKTLFRMTVAAVNSTTFNLAKKSLQQPTFYLGPAGSGKKLLS